MRFDTLEIRVSLQKLLIALVVIIVPLNFIGLYLSSESVTSLEQAIGTHFKAIAQADSVAALQFVNDRVVDVGAIAGDPTVVDVAVKANRSYEHMSDEATSAKISEIENQWDTPKADALVSTMLSTPASRFLRRLRETNPRILKVVVVDEAGVPVAATDKPVHYAPVDKAYWQAVFAQGKGSLHVSEVLYDEQSNSNYIEIGFPVYDEGSQRFIGAVNALVDVSSLFSRFNQTQMGRTFRTAVVKDDGGVISAPNVASTMQLKSEEYLAVRDALGTVQGRQAGYVVTTGRAGVEIVGFADTGLKQIYPNLAWFIVVSQEGREVLAPVRTVGYFAILMVLVGLLMVTLLAAYFYLHRKQQLSDLEEAVAEKPPNNRAA